MANFKLSGNEARFKESIENGCPVVYMFMNNPIIFLLILIPTTIWSSMKKLENFITMDETFNETQKLYLDSR